MMLSWRQFVGVTLAWIEITDGKELKNRMMPWFTVLEKKQQIF